MKAIVSSQDPQIMSEGVIILVTDTLWKGLVRAMFLQRKMWFICSLVVFMGSQAILPNMNLPDDMKEGKNIAIFILRVITYFGGMRGSAWHHMKKCYSELRKGNHTKI